MKIVFLILVLAIMHLVACSQDIAPVKSPDTDTTYIAAFQKLNDFRLTLGTKGSALTYGSTNQSGNSVAGTYNNTNDVIGFGLTYKFIDFDLLFSLPKTRLLPQGEQDLQQFRLSGSYYGRQWTMTGYWRDGRGMVVSDAKGGFESTPDVHLLIIGAHFTHNFNSSRYSYKMANFQNELQRQSSGGFLLRIEPYYRRIGIGSSLAPPALDTPATYGEQAGLGYVSSPGIIFMPGYGYNLVFRGGDFFVSPYLFAGGGAAYTGYRGDLGEKTVFNAEWAALASMNFGYNGKRIYAALRYVYETHHFNLNPSYFTTTDIRLTIVAGYRFADVEKAIPRL